MVLMTFILPLRSLHRAIMVDNRLVPFLGKAFFWNTILTPVLIYFFSVFTFSSISKIFLLLVFSSAPKFKGPFSNYFNNFSSSIFCYKSFFSSWLILGFGYFFSIFLVLRTFCWIFGICWGAFLIEISTTSSDSD